MGLGRAGLGRVGLGREKILRESRVVNSLSRCSLYIFPPLSLSEDCTDGDGIDDDDGDGDDDERQ